MVAGLLLSGCVSKQIQRSEPVSFVFKTPVLKIAASGFLQKGRIIKLQGYDAGQPILELILAKRVCINSKCMSYAMFNKRVLYPAYPPFIIRNIVTGKPIFNGQNLEKRGDGFVQEITSKQFAIIYRVKKDVIYFKDRKNRILIKIKELY
ncbi:hypothetical protein NitYY0918_C0312 [Nitratiruptor sp. YY09-18]|nr:hypothetical protein NitYY0918_C0312 [Nitratiruptor sp. YY09-18]